MPAKLIILLVAVMHLYFMVLEMFLWETRGRKIFKGALPDPLFTPTKVMAANQGLYNGFLAGGLIWSLLITNSEWQTYVATFFLSCVALAGIYASITISKKIFFVQSLPALIGLVAIWV